MKKIIKILVVILALGALIEPLMSKVTDPPNMRGRGKTFGEPAP